MPEREPAECASPHFTFSPEKSSLSQWEQEESRRPQNRLEGQVTPPLLCHFVLVVFFLVKTRPTQTFVFLSVTFRLNNAAPLLTLLLTLLTLCCHRPPHVTII